MGVLYHNFLYKQSALKGSALNGSYPIKYYWILIKNPTPIHISPVSAFLLGCIRVAADSHDAKIESQLREPGGLVRI
jgi:hypothetical protein